MTSYESAAELGSKATDRKSRVGENKLQNNFTRTSLLSKLLWKLYISISDPGSIIKCQNNLIMGGTNRPFSFVITRSA